MKRIHLTIALCALGFAGCTQEDEIAAPQNDGQEIRVAFTTHAVEARVNTLDEGNVWDAGDKILVVNTANSGSATFTADAEGETTTWTQEGKLLWQGDEDNTLVASYPATNEYGSFTLPEDQDSEADLKAADYMNARYTGSKEDGDVKFEMAHRMAMITVTYTVANEFDANTHPTEAEVLSKHSGATFDNEGTMTATGTEQYVSAYLYTENDENKFSAIVVPGEYAVDDELMRITINGEELKVKVKEAFTLAEGERYTFTLQVGKEYIIVDENTTADGLQSATRRSWKTAKPTSELRFLPMPITMTR